jgi:transposase
MAFRDARGNRRVDNDLEDAGPAQADAEKKSIRAAEQLRADVADAREVWRELQSKLDATKLIFLDETWAKTNMTRLYGRSPRGHRLLGRAPYGHWKTTTFLAGLCHDGIVAPLVLDGPINGRAFLAWVEQFLAPTLQPGQIVIADRLGSHKVAGVREAIEARGAELMLLPPYSHDFNPIEQVFAKLKALLRKAEPRTRESLWKTIGEKINMFSPDECLNYLRHCGYGHPA